MNNYALREVSLGD